MNCFNEKTFRYFFPIVLDECLKRVFFSTHSPFSLFTFSGSIWIRVYGVEKKKQWNFRSEKEFQEQQHQHQHQHQHPHQYQYHQKLNFAGFNMLSACLHQSVECEQRGFSYFFFFFCFFFSFKITSNLCHKKFWFLSVVLEKKEGT